MLEEIINAVREANEDQSTTLIPKSILGATSIAPYVFFFKINDEWGAGIVLNQTRRIVYYYDLLQMPEKLAKELLSIAFEWYWLNEARHPLHFFRGSESMKRFEMHLKGTPLKIISQQHGLCFSIDHISKRTKRTKIPLEEI